MPKRKPRNKMSKKIDITKPVTLEMLGTKDDPCFGALYDPREAACQRCGDNELCAIAMSQNNHISRAKIEAEQKFKDLEESKIPPPVEKNVIKKSIKKRIREMIKAAGKVGVTKDAIIHDIYSSYGKDGFTKKLIGKLIDSVQTKSDTITIQNNKYVWSK